MTSSRSTTAAAVRARWASGNEQRDGVGLMAIDPNGRRVLVAEESEVIRRVLSLILQGEGYQVDLADDGYSALLLARSLQPDAVALDLGLHDPDGSEVLRRLKEDPSTRSIPVVVIS